MSQEPPQEIPDRISCTDVTGIQCDYVAELDESSLWADRGGADDQLLAQLTSHVSTDHPERPLSPDEISEIRSRLRGE